MNEVVDGVTYVERGCVDCGTAMSVSEEALRVMRGLRWPRCQLCIAENERRREGRVLGERKQARG